MFVSSPFGPSHFPTQKTVVSSLRVGRLGLVVNIGLK